MSTINKLNLSKSSAAIKPISFEILVDTLENKIANKLAKHYLKRLRKENLTHKQIFILKNDGIYMQQTT